jgi:DNA-binding SARP family transcriptional activator
MSELQDVDGVILHLIEQSQELEDGGDIAGAFARARRALRQASGAGGSKSAQAHAFVRLGKLQFRIGDYQEAVRLAKKTLEMATEDSPACAQAWLVLGNCAAETDSLAEAESHFQNVIDLSNKYGFPLLRYRALHCLSVGVYEPRGQFDLALAADREALSILEKIGEREEMWRPLFTMAYIDWLTGRLDKAYSMVNALCEVVRPESPGAAHCKCLQALLALEDAEQGDYEVILSNFSRAQEAADALGDPGLRVFVRTGLSCFYRRVGDLAAAWDWANDALFIANRTGYQHFHGISLIERGRAAWENEDLSAAEADFRAARALLSRLDARFDLAKVNLILAALLFQTGNSEVEQVWLEAARGIVAGGYAFLAFREQRLVFQLLERFLDSGDLEVARASARLLSQVQAIPPDPLHVRTLGDFQVWKACQMVDKRALRQRRAGELFALLLQTPGRSLLFDQISECLWPARDPSQTRTLFHHACASLRKALEPDLPEKIASRYLVVDEGRVTLQWPAGSELDYETFEDLLRQEEWAAAVALYRGDYLPDFLYAEWTQASRQRLELLAQNAMLSLAQCLVDRGEFHAALEACNRLLSLEPWHEGATWLGMQASQALHDRVGAIRLYKNLEKALQSELGIPPSTELQELYKTLTRRPPHPAF